MSGCEKWKQGLLGAALGDLESPGLEEHLAACAACREALAGLRERSQQMDSGLRTLVRVDGPSPAFRARLMGLIGAQHVAWFGWRVSVRKISAGVALAVVGIMLALSLNRRGGPTDSAAIFPTAVAISEWRSPTELLLRTSADELLKASPRIGESYFPLESSHQRSDREDQRRNP